VRRLSAELVRRLADGLVRLSAIDLRLEAEFEEDRRVELARIHGEIAAVADYVTRLRAQIRALRPNELLNARLPQARGELSDVKAEGETASNAIMAAAEGILSIEDLPPAEYRGLVEEKVFEIMQACSFQDLAGQRITRATTALTEIEKRLARFASAVKVPDAVENFDRAAIMREARKEVLLVEGPQAATIAIEQDAVDRMFA
jgi:chemotaxis protein CheZ